MSDQQDESGRITSTGLARAAVFVVLCTVLAFLAANYDRAPTDVLKVGDVATRTVKAPFTFTFQDFEAYQRRRTEAGENVKPVFLHRSELKGVLVQRLREAFSFGRSALEAEGVTVGGFAESERRTLRADVGVALDEAKRDEAAARFIELLAVHLPDPEVQRILDMGFDEAIEEQSVNLIEHAMGRLIVANITTLPDGASAITLIELRGMVRAEDTVTDLANILDLDGARQLISIKALESKSGTSEARVVDSAATVARALVRPNLTFESLETEERRRAAEAAEPLQAESVKRGTILFRQGDVLTEQDLLEYDALKSFKTEHPFWMEVLSIGVFIFLFLGCLYQFGHSFFSRFSTKVRDVVAVSVCLGGTMAMARVTVAGSESVALLVGYEAEATSVWFVVPVAGVAMLVRLLLGVPWTVVYIISAACLCGLVMDLRALHVMFFIVSAFAGAGAIQQVRERRAVLSAGLFAGVINAACVLLIHLVQLFLADADVNLATSTRPLWSIGFAFVGGLFSGVLVLGVVPLFELAGFVTDYRLMELVNLNHPLLRKLMLRAPGSYHHSVLVGTLAEAACEAIGANALQAKVAAYFHDIGKAERPQYFIENQRDGVNKHNQLDPYTSAKYIVDHVVVGAQLAREQGLPKPIIDNIYMHHGDGLLQYFYAAAVERDGENVDEAAFRYPGPRPNTREAGVVMLADKVEAATRTIRNPTEENIRSMINRIINSVIADGQFSECPLTFKELHTIADTFVGVLLGIYHQRIEYPQTRDITSRSSDDDEELSESAVITLELSNIRGRPVSTPPQRSPVGSPGNPDYESVENLPSSKV